MSEQQCARLTGRFTEAQIVSASSAPTIRNGSDMVQNAQRLLISLGHLRGQADGVQGNQTTAAVKAFQKTRSVSQTGEINDDLVALLKLADQTQKQTTKVEVAKSLAQLREERQSDTVRIAILAKKAQRTKQILAIIRQNQPGARTPAGIEFGGYHALVIGISDYQNLPKLRTAIADAEAIGEALKSNYGFAVATLLNPTRDQIVDKLDDLRATLTPTDNLLIYYAGHGWLDNQADQGFWLPIDADRGRRSHWVANASITGTLKAIKAKHVMVVADSCYSGRLVRGVERSVKSTETANYLQQMSRKKTRVVITSGGLEPVEDGKGTHSPFASAFLKALDDNQGVIDGSKFFNAVRRPVMLAADQTPQYSNMRRAGHDGGDFLFVRRK